MTRKAIPIGQLIRVYLDLRDMTQKDFAVSIGMSPQFLSDIIRGKKQLPTEWLQRMPPDLKVSLLPIEVERLQGQINQLRRMLKDARATVRKT